MLSSLLLAFEGVEMIECFSRKSCGTRPLEFEESREVSMTLKSGV